MRSCFFSWIADGDCHVVDALGGNPAQFHCGINQLAVDNPDRASILDFKTDNQILHWLADVHDWCCSGNPILYSFRVWVVSVSSH